MIYKVYDIVVVPFPFTDQHTDKRRPALVLSDVNIFNSKTQNCIMAMITSARHSNWPLDLDISDIQEAGLPAPSKIRMKFFTLDTRLVIKKVGVLSIRDQVTLKENLKQLLCM